jgi:hypothetical protein
MNSSPTRRTLRRQQPFWEHPRWKVGRDRRYKTNWLALAVFSLATLGFWASAFTYTAYGWPEHTKGAYRLPQRSVVPTKATPKDPCSLLVVDCTPKANAKVAPTKLTAVNQIPVALHDAITTACADSLLPEQCRKDLTAIATVETHGNVKAIGDSGSSRGAFQIHLGYHPDITVAQATDPLWSSRWVVKRLQTHGWPKYRQVAIRRHNGSAKNPKTLIYFNKVNAIANQL